MFKSLGFLGLAIAAPMAIGMTAETGYAAPAPAPAPTIEQDITSETLSFDKARLDRNLALSTTTNTAATDSRERECMAKVVHHEARGQTREGQLAVAQLMITRRDSGRFPETICGVAAQRGQFFDVTQYTPRDDATWAIAQSVADEALSGTRATVVPGAVFYHAATQSATAFFRTRQRVATLGGHVFYR